MTRKLIAAVADTLPNPNSARELPALARRAGLKDLQIETYALTTTHRFQVHALGGASRQAVERGVLSKSELDEWWDEQARLHESGDFFQAWLFVRVTGTV